MKISTTTDYFAELYGDEAAIRKLGKIGFDCFDYTMFGLDEKNHLVFGNEYKSYVNRLKRAADESGIECNQSHAAFPACNPYDDDHNNRVFPLLVRSIEVTGMLGGKTIVIHPVVFHGHKIGGDQICWDANMKFYDSLLKYAKEFNVRIGIENIFNWYPGDSTASPGTCTSADEFVKYLDVLGSDYFTGCLDVGHSSMQNTGGESVEHMIRALGKDRLKALHIHDNDLIYDLHSLPFVQKIRWDDVISALVEIQYDGELTFEADAFLRRFPEELVEHVSRLMLEVGRYFARKFN